MLRIMASGYWKHPKTSTECQVLLARYIIFHGQHQYQET